MSQVKAILFRAAAGFLLSCFATLGLFGQDVQINNCPVTCTLTPAGGVPWGQGNIAYIFRPINPHVSIYIFIRNLNPSNPHTSQTINVWQTPFSQDSAPSLSKNSSRWTQDTVIQNATTGASCTNVNALNDSSPGASGLGSCYVITVFAAQVAIQIAGAATQAGSPDNYDLAIVQETGVPAGQTPASGTTVQPPFPVTGPLQPATVKNSQTNGGTNASITFTIPAVSGQRVYLFSLAGFGTAAPACGTNAIIIRDGVGGTSIYASDNSFWTTSLRSLTWPVPLSTSVGNGLEIDVPACGGGVSIAIFVQASQL